MDLIKHYSNETNSQIYKRTKVNFKNTAFYSLKIALKAFFSSYHSMLEHLDEHTEPKEILRHSDSYYESYIESIVHFQHFFELILKDILEKENPLLAVRASNNPVLLHKLLLKEEISEDEYNKLFSIEFSDALSTLCKLIKSDRIVNEDYTVFTENKNVLDALNNFRNRIWHKGRFSLKYHALDEFIGKYILPFVLEVVNFEDYKKYISIWRNHNLNSLKIDVINGIVEEFKKENPDYTKVALLKEVGRVEFSNVNLFQLSREKQENIDIMTKIEETQNFVSEVLECPVCGKKALLNHHEYESWIEELGDETTPHYSSFEVNELLENRVHCLLCHFEVGRFVNNPKEYGYSDLRFWNE